MSKSFSIFLIFILMCSIIPHAKADENVWDEGPLNITWSTTAANAIVFDTDANGVADQLYTYSISGTTRSITKVLGNGAAGTTSLTAPVAGTLNNVTPDGTKAFFATGSNTGGSCKNYSSTINVISAATVANDLNNTKAVSGTATVQLSRAWAGLSGESVVTNGCFSSTGNAEFVVKNSTTNWATYTAVGAGTFFGGPYASGAFDGTYVMVDGKSNVFNTGTAPSFTVLGPGWMGGDLLLFKSASVPIAVPIAAGGATYSAVPIDSKVQLYADGLDLPTGKTLRPVDTYWKSYLSSGSLSKWDFLVKLHYKLLDPTLTADVVRFKFKTGSIEYIMYVSGTTVKYVDISTIDLSNRALASYTIDTNPPGLDVLPIGSNWPGYYAYLVVNDAITGAKTFGTFNLVSGYTLKPGSSTARIMDPEVTNKTDVIPWYGWILGSNSSQSTITANIKNAPLPQGINIESNAAFSFLSKNSLGHTGEGFPGGMSFSANGTKLFHGGQTVDMIYSWSLGTPYVTTTAQYDYKSLNVNAQDSIPIDFSFSTDGLKFYMMGSNSKTVYQYNLTTAWDIATAAYGSKSKSVSAQTNSPFTVQFKPDGLYMVVGNFGTGAFYGYTLSTAWNVSTASYNSKTFDTPYTNVWQFHGNSDGTHFILIDNLNDTLASFTCITGWDLSTCTLDSTSIDVSQYVTGLIGMALSADGDRLTITGSSPFRYFYDFTMSTPWDLSTLEFDMPPYTWTLDHMAADRTYAVDLPVSDCHNWQIRDLSEVDQPWLDLGELCNSGSMPKTIAYLSDLAFTFWTLPWGTSHTYDQDATNLETTVRHAVPYSYFVDVYDKNDILVDSQEYTVSSGSELDIQDVDTSSFDLPSRVIIKDDTNSTLYTATIGYPSYLSGVAAFFNQYFEIDGFNLLYMMPIVFAAMFTRNSVAIGTGMTVAFIASLAWLGVITIAEPILYLMIFVTILGMIVYRMLYY